MKDAAKSIRSIATRTFAVALIVAGSFSFAPGSAIARHSPQPWRLKPQGEGILNRVNVAKRNINVTHDRIDLLNWPAGTTDFGVAPGVDLGALKRGERMVFSVARGKDGRFIVQEIRLDD